MSSCQGVPAPAAALEEFVILFGLTLTQFVYGAYSVFLSRVLSLGINPLFLVLAGNLVSFVLLAPFSAALERKKWPKKASAWLMLQFGLISLGGVAFQALMLMGIEKTSPAIASAMPNLSPGFIFIIAACLRPNSRNLHPSASSPTGCSAVILEVVCSWRPSSEVAGFRFLADWAWKLQREGCLLDVVAASGALHPRRPAASCQGPPAGEGLIFGFLPRPAVLPRDQRQQRRAGLHQDDQS